MATITIDNSWILANGGVDGPWYLTGNGNTYNLAVDVTALGTAFAIISPNITFNLNSHRITYNNAAAITLSNASFETGSGAAATGWDFTSAPNGARFAGNYLSSQIYDGDYSLRFAVTTGNEHVNNGSTISLAANRTYSLSAMFEYGAVGDSNPGATAYIQLIGTGGESTRELEWTGDTGRGIQLKEYVFKTGGSAENYTLRAGIRGHGSSTKPFYIDDIKVQMTHVYGIATQVQDYGLENYTDLDVTGVGSGSTINGPGEIVQGADNGTFCHGVFMHGVTGITVSGMDDITVSGPNSSAIIGIDTGLASNTVTGNTCNSDVRTITSRDNYNGAVISGICGTISNNVIEGGCHSGIALTHDSDIFGNTIRLKSKYTNGFGISADYGSDIYDNEILCSEGEYAARGILAGGTEAKPTIVHGNTVRVKELANKQEYGGQQINGAYGIQFDSAGYASEYDNDVEVNAVDGCDGHCIRCTDLSEPVSTTGSRLTAYSDGTGGHASLWSFDSCDGSLITIEPESATTNDGYIGASASTLGLLIRGGRIGAADVIASPLAFSVYDYPAQGLPEPHVTATFFGTHWADAESRTYAEESIPQFVPRFGGGDAPDRMEIEVRMISDDLISYWGFDEASGNLVDSHGSNTLTETGGAIAATTGKLGGCRDFTAAQHRYFEIADNADLSTGDIDFSFAGWFMREEIVSYPRLFGKWGASGSLDEYEAYVDSDDGKPTFAARNSSSTLTEVKWGSLISVDTWYYLAVGHSAADNTIWISVNAGTPVTAAHASGVRNGTNPFQFGAVSAWPTYWAGKLDDWGFWKRDIRADLAELYASGSGLAYPFGESAPPVNTVAPSISLFPYATETISTTSGTWDGDPTSYSYQWRVANDGAGAGAADIVGATSSSYALSSTYWGKYLRCVVTATNADGSTAANATLFGASWFYVFAPVTRDAITFIEGDWDDFGSEDGVDIFNETIGDGTNDLVPFPLSFNSGLNAKFRAPWFCVASEFNGVVGRETDAKAGCGATLISPRHVLMVQHCRPSAVYFKQANGTEVYREIEWYDWINTDLSVGRLDSEVTTIDPVPILAAGGHAIGKYGALLEAGRFLSRLQITENGDTFSVSSSEAETGDSGHPVFLVNGTQPVLVGLISGVGTDGVGHSATANIDRINAVLALYNESLTLVSPPVAAGNGPAVATVNSPLKLPLILSGT